MSKKTKQILFVAMVLIFVLMCAVSLNTKADETYPITYRVTASTLNVRFAPGIQYETFYQLTAGEEVCGKESEGSWTEINCYGFKGYVWSGYIRNISTPTSTSSSGGGNMTYLGNYYVTGYDPYCSHCCGKSNGITASGAKAVVGSTCAMSGISFGTRVYIKGLGYYIVQDRGVGKGCIDVTCSGHQACYAVTGRYEVYIVN